MLFSSCEIRIRTERRAGELLIEMQQNGQRQKQAQPCKYLKSRSTAIRGISGVRDRSRKRQYRNHLP